MGVSLLSPFPFSMSRLYVTDCRTKFRRFGKYYLIPGGSGRDSLSDVEPFPFICFIPFCKRYAYPWLLVCRINGNLIASNFHYPRHRTSLTLVNVLVSHYCLLGIRVTPPETSNTNRVMQPSSWILRTPTASAFRVLR